MWKISTKKGRLKALEKVKAEMDDLRAQLKEQADNQTSVLNSAIFDFDMPSMKNVIEGSALASPKLTASHGMDSSGEDLFNASKSAFTMGSSRVNELVFSWYISQGFIGWQACALMAQHWLVDAACTTNAEAAIKRGWELTVNTGDDVDPKIMAKLKKFDKRMKVKQSLIEFDKHRKIFGIRIAMPIFSGNYDYEKPFNIDGVKPGTYKGMSQIDPYWITPLLDESAVADQSSINFYEPTWWEVTTGKKTTKVHRSHLIVTRYSEVTDILKPTYIYGGLPLVQLIFERIYAAERTANEAPLLAATKRMTVLYQDLNSAVADPAKFIKTITQWAQFRDNHGVKVAGKGDVVQEFDTNLAGLDETIMTQYQIVAAIAKTPVSELMKTQLKGFNSTGEGERQSWYSELEKIQEYVYDPFLDRHYELLVKSEFKGEFDIDVVWNPLESPTDKDIAEINKSKADTDKLLWEMGAITDIEIRDRLIADETSCYNGLEALEVIEPTDEDESKVDGNESKETDE